jgi:hypothetical protein
MDKMKKMYIYDADILPYSTIKFDGLNIGDLIEITVKNDTLIVLVTKIMIDDVWDLKYVTAEIIYYTKNWRDPGENIYWVTEFNSVTINKKIN